MTRTSLSSFDNSWYKPGPRWKRALWYCVNAVFFRSYLFHSVRLKRFLLRAFGARIGKGLVIKPGINIKYPWFFQAGDHCWIGEGVWIDNLERVHLKNDVCISQGALLLTGNHDFTKTSFDLHVGPILLEDGVWVGARSVVTPGCTIRSHAVVAVGSVAVGELGAFTVYQGNPAVEKRKRVIS